MAGFWSRLMGRPEVEQKATSPIDLALDLMQAAASKTGLRVTAETALQASTALACARVIADGIAQVPLKLMRARPGGGADPATDHPLYSVLASAVNPWCTSFEWRETIGLHLSLGYRAYCLINRSANVRSSSVALTPLVPGDMRIENSNRGPRFFWRDPETREETELPAERVLHLHGPSWDGIQGLDGVRLAREAIGLALATEEHGSRFFSNGGASGGVLSTDQNLKPEQAAAMRESWERTQAGVGNAYRTAVLWGGMRWQARAQQNDQAQWVEVRRFQVQEVCRFFRVLPIMVGEADRTATYASSEQMFLAHAVHTMGPWYARLEQRLDLQLLTQAERAAGFYTQFAMQGLLRGAHRDRAEFYRTLHALGALNANEIRGLEDLNPYPAGDEYVRPVNMAPVTDPTPADSGIGGNQ